MKYFFIPITWALIILILSLISAPALPAVEIDYADKIAHFSIYCILVLLLIWAFYKNNRENLNSFTTIFTIFASCSLYGVLIEILQFTSNTGRNFEIPDIIANIVGCLFGVLLSNLFKKLSS